MSSKIEEVTILGVDPGTNIMGYSLLRIVGKQTDVVEMNVIQIKHINSPMAKLKFIFDKIEVLILKYHPTILAIEAPFYGKNPQSMLKLGRAQGVVISACLHHGLEIFEYAPRKIKQSITGRGSASKEQVAAMLKNMYHFEEIPKYLDATDALAVATCYHLQYKISTNEKKFSSWDSFLAKNKDRIV